MACPKNPRHCVRVEHPIGGKPTLFCLHCLQHYAKCPAHHHGGLTCRELEGHKGLHVSLDGTVEWEGAPVLFDEMKMRLPDFRARKVREEPVVVHVHVK